MKKKLITIFLLILAATFLLPLTSLASEPYQTYTYSIDGFALYSPAAYSPVMVVDSNYMGLLDEENGGVGIAEPGDVFADKQGNVYIADTKNSRVVVLDQYFKLKFTLSTFSNAFGSEYALANPRGLFVTDDYIYVCDTGNSRIVMFDLDGNFVKIVPRPVSNLFGNNASYKPVALAVDQYGRIFVVSSTTYQGVIVMTEDGTFTGFIGAQKVVTSAIDMIWRQFMSEESRRNNTVAYLSVEFNNITVDRDGFVYVTTDAIDSEKQAAAIESKSADYSPIKKLNSAGKEIMKRNGFFDPGGEVDITNFEAKVQGPSKIKDVAVGPQDTWSIIDSARNKVFTYDQNGNLLFAFGDTGDVLGQMKSLSGITYQGENMILLDNSNNTLTVYRRTHYGDLLIGAIEQENLRNYGQAIDAWNAVLQYNNNFDTAYIGVGRALYRNGDYETAMDYFKAAYDSEDYSNAYREVRKEWISKWLWTIPLVVGVFCFALAKIMKYAARVNAEVAVRPNRKTTYWEELLYSFHIVFHPFDGFWDLKHEKRGSIRASLTFIGILVLSFFYQSVGTGYIMNPKNEYGTFLGQAISVLIPIVLWIIANWCLTTLFEGEGSFKDIIKAVGYAISPLSFILIITTLLSNIVTAEEAGIISLVVAVGYVWCGLLIFFGFMTTHDYSTGKNLITVIGTIVGMAIIIFVALLFSGLIAKMISFVSSIITEIAYRM